MVLYMRPDSETFSPSAARHARTEGGPRRQYKIADMERSAREILRAKGVDPDGIADQGDIAADLGIPRRSVSWLRQQYKGAKGTRGKTLEPFPPPAKVVGGGAGNPVWLPRWQPLAWHLTRPQTAHREPASRASKQGSP